MESLHNLNIERSILSSIFFNPELLEETSSILKPKDFYLPAHRYIFNAMILCEQEDLPVDEEFVRKKLLQDGKFDEDVMLEIIGTNPLPTIFAYANEIKDKSIKRTLVSLTSDITDVALKQDLPAHEVLDGIQQKLYQISQESSDKEFRESSEVVVATLERIEELKRRGNQIVVGLDTGFTKLNELTTGFGDGDLIIIAARPAMGKTAFCLNLAQKALDLDKGVAIFSLEMPAEQLMLRMLSAKTSIPLQKLRVGNLNDDEWSRLSDACSGMEKKKLFIDDGGNVDIHKVRAKLRKLKTNHPEVSLCIIDYLQLMSGTSKKDRHLEVSEISRGLKLLARELEMPVIALSQLNRWVESRHDKRPMLSDIRESGAIEQDADMILFVYRDDVYREKEEKEREQRARAEGKEYRSDFVSKMEEDAEIIIGKNRNGPIGKVKLVFQKECTRFVDSGAVPIEIVYSGDEQTNSTFVPPKE